jgi:hypothetical protein
VFTSKPSYEYIIIVGQCCKYFYGCKKQPKFRVCLPSLLMVKVEDMFLIINKKFFLLHINTDFTVISIRQSSVYVYSHIPQWIDQQCIHRHFVHIN